MWKLIYRQWVKGVEIFFRTILFGMVYFTGVFPLYLYQYTYLHTNKRSGILLIALYVFYMIFLLPLIFYWAGVFSGFAKKVKRNQ